MHWNDYRAKTAQTQQSCHQVPFGSAIFLESGLLGHALLGTKPFEKRKPHEGGASSVRIHLPRTGRGPLYEAGEYRAGFCTLLKTLGRSDAAVNIRCQFRDSMPPTAVRRLASESDVQGGAVVPRLRGMSAANPEQGGRGLARLAQPISFGEEGRVGAIDPETTKGRPRRPRFYGPGRLVITAQVQLE